MNNDPTQAVDPQNPSVHVHFGRFASRASAWFGSTWAFVAAGIIILGWAATGPVFHFSAQWTGIIGTGTQPPHVSSWSCSSRTRRIAIPAPSI